MGRDRTVVVVGNDHVSAISRQVQAVPVDLDGTLPETLVTVRVAEPVVGIARVVDTGPFRWARFADPRAVRHGPIDAATMERIEVALRAVFDL
ncbi:MAG TPA: hypothetical protein VGR21_05355 [Cryptosporangiaceae bacterium]|nr:hypothetical protein [Cryptosporangiaceae bacterium]